jgi:hypothetical protein
MIKIVNHRETVEDKQRDHIFFEEVTHKVFLFGWKVKEIKDSYNCTEKEKKSNDKKLGF